MPDSGLPSLQIPIADRGFQYGDGVFETLAVDNGEALLLARHVQRLTAGCQRLGIDAPSSETLCAQVQRLADTGGRGVVKLIVTRGDGARGYGPQGAGPTRVVAARYPWPERCDELARTGVAVRLCKTALARNPSLAGIKHLNRLEQVLARAEWDDQRYAEGLMLDTEGHLVEGTMSNVFLVVDGALLTPDLSDCGVAGIIRDVVIELATQITGRPVSVGTVTTTSLANADEVFLCNSVIGLWPVTRVEQFTLPIGQLTLELSRALIRAKAFATR